MASFEGLNGSDRSMLYGEVVSDGIDGNEDDEAVKRQGINVALLSFIPFASAAIGMLVSTKITVEIKPDPIISDWC